MKHRCLVLLLSLIFLSGTALALPRLEPGNPEFDFGEVVQGQNVEHTFTFGNRGDSDLIIERVRSSCGCTAALLSAERIPPGETGEVKAVFDSSRFRGEVVKTVSIYGNDPQRQMVTFRLKGSVRPELLIQPERVDLGTLSPGESRAGRVELINQGDHDITIVSALSTTRGLDAEVPEAVLPPGKKVTLHLRILAPESGRFSGYVILRTTGGTLPEVRIPVSGIISGA